MKRREFVTALGGAAAAWPFAVRAQQGERMRRVVLLHGLAENDQEALARVAAFREGLEALGWVENRNIKIEHRFSGGDIARIQAQVAEVVGSAPDVIAASGTPVIAALKQATGAIPIVFSVVNDPAGQGFVASLARPGGNITGFTFVDFPMIGKWLEMLKEIAPGVRRMTLVQSTDRALLSCIPARIWSERSTTRSHAFGNAGARQSGNRDGRHGVCARPGGWSDRRSGPIHQHAACTNHHVGRALSNPNAVWLSAAR